jgi:hypothetical protein
MKKNAFYNIKTMLIIIILVVLIRMIGILPWWSFVIPVIILGMVITFRAWHVSGFIVGFLSGLITWIGVNLYFDLTSNGIILNRIGLLLMMPKIIVILISGLIGGILTGLALYTGQNIMVYSEISDLEEKVK